MKVGRYASHMGVRSRLAAKRWMRRLLFLAGGIAVGLAAILMTYLADEAQALFSRLVAAWPSAPLVVTPVGFAVAALLATRVFPNSQGSGIPQVIAALHMADKKSAAALVSLRAGVGKVIIMTLGLCCGASIGREGPTVQVGGAIMYALGRWAPYRQMNFLLAGGAAGVSAAFNTPLAGVVFAIEELGRSFESRTSGLIIGAVIAAGLTSLAIMGDYNYFGVTSTTLPLGGAWLSILVCASICGLAGGAFSRVLLAFIGGLPGAAGAFLKRQPILVAAICGLGVGACTVLSGQHVFGTGYDQAKAILHGTEEVAPGYGALKYLATLISGISNIPGGILSPSLSIGAGIASDLRGLFPGVPIAALALVGMVSYLTGVLQAPITSFVITFEMTNDSDMVIPLMLAALVANATSKVVVPEGLYLGIARILVRRADEAARP